MSINTNQQLLDAIRDSVTQPTPVLSLNAETPAYFETTDRVTYAYNAPADTIVGVGVGGDDDANATITGNADLLAVSCTMWRTQLGHGSLLNGEYTPTAQDIEKAEKIRSYYKNKLIFAKLKSGSLSEYRTDLYTFLNTDGTTFPKKMIGIAYYLPRFFDYDMSLKDILASPLLKHELLDPTSTDHPGGWIPTSWRRTPSSNACDLKNMVRLGTTHRLMKSKNCREYWMTNDSRALFLISIDSCNPLRFMWEEVYYQNGPLAFQALLTPRQVNGTNLCHELRSWRFISNT